jgi:hypothetical protein
MATETILEKLVMKNINTNIPEHDRKYEIMIAKAIINIYSKGNLNANQVFVMYRMHDWLDLRN